MATAVTTPTASTTSGLFTRQASGLVRELGIPAAVGISLASVAVVNTFINFNAGLTSFTKAEFYLPLLVAAFIWFVAMFAYRHLLAAVPRAGGEYVYLSRIVSPVAGSIAGLGDRGRVHLRAVGERALRGHVHAVHADRARFRVQQPCDHQCRQPCHQQRRRRRDQLRRDDPLRGAVDLLAEASRADHPRPDLRPIGRVPDPGAAARRPLARDVRQLRRELQRPSRRLPGADRRRHQERGLLRRRLRRDDRNHPVHGAQLQRRPLFLLRRWRAAQTGPHVPVGLIDQPRRPRHRVGRRVGAAAPYRGPSLHAGPGEPRRRQPRHLFRASPTSTLRPVASATG